MIARPIKMSRVERRCKAHLRRTRKDLFKILDVPDSKANKNALDALLATFTVDVEDLVFNEIWNIVYANRHYFYTEEQNAAD